MGVGVGATDPKDTTNTQTQLSVAVLWISQFRRLLPLILVIREDGFLGEEYGSSGVGDVWFIPTEAFVPKTKISLANDDDIFLLSAETSTHLGFLWARVLPIQRRPGEGEIESRGVRGRWERCSRTTKIGKIEDRNILRHLVGFECGL